MDVYSSQESGANDLLRFSQGPIRHCKTYTHRQLARLGIEHLTPARYHYTSGIKTRISALTHQCTTGHKALKEVIW